MFAARNVYENSNVRDDVVLTFLRGLSTNEGGACKHDEIAPFEMCRQRVTVKIKFCTETFDGPGRTKKYLARFWHNQAPERVVIGKKKTPTNEFETRRYTRVSQGVEAL